jgi:hypothetical protein
MSLAICDISLLLGLFDSGCHGSFGCSFVSWNEIQKLEILRVSIM